MLSPFADYKKPLSKEDEKEEFDSLYQLLQSMVKPPPSNTETKNEIITPPLIIKETVQPIEEKKASSPIINHPLIIKENHTKEESNTVSSEPTEEMGLDSDIIASPDVFELYKGIRRRGRPKGSKTSKEKRKKKQENDESESMEDEDEVVIPFHVELPKSMKHAAIRPTPYPNGVICKCCFESFPQNSDYLLHFNRSEICMNIMIQPLYCQPRHELIKPLHIIIAEWLSAAVSDGKNLFTCRHCRVSFKNQGNLNKHLYTSLPCNRIAYMEFKKIVADY